MGKASPLLQGERAAKRGGWASRMHGDVATSLQQKGTHRGAARDTPEKSRTTWQLFHSGLTKGAAFLLS